MREAMADQRVFRFAEHRARINHVVEVLTRLEDVLRDLGMEKGCELLSAEKERMEASCFRVAIVGEFKRGKSTLVNALAGQAILPSDPLPCSATLFRLLYDKSASCRVHRRDGGIRDLPIDDVRHIGTKLTKESEKESELISEIVIRYPIEICSYGVEIIDTPGLNDSDNMTAVTLSVLPNVDATIMVMVPEAPVSETERSFIAEHLLLDNLCRLVFVVNAIDRIAKEEDRSRLLDHMSQRIVKILDERVEQQLDGDIDIRDDLLTQLSQPKLFGISSQMALQAKVEGDPEKLDCSGFARLEASLEELLVGGQGSLLFSRTLSRVLKSVRRAMDIVQMRAAYLRTEYGRTLGALAQSQESYNVLRRDIDSRKGAFGWSCLKDIRNIVVDPSGYNDLITREVVKVIDQYDLSTLQVTGSQSMQIVEDLNKQLNNLLQASAIAIFHKYSHRLGQYFRYRVEKLNEGLDELEDGLSEIFQLQKRSASRRRLDVTPLDFQPNHSTALSGSLARFADELASATRCVLQIGTGLRGQRVNDFRNRLKEAACARIREVDMPAQLALAIRDRACEIVERLENQFAEEAEALLSDFHSNLKQMETEVGLNGPGTDSYLGPLKVSCRNMRNVLERIRQVAPWAEMPGRKTGSPCEWGRIIDQTIADIDRIERDLSDDSQRMREGRRMNQILKIGQTVRLAAAGLSCRVDEFLGGGGQGEVYRADLAGRPVALKWYFPGSATKEQRSGLEVLIQKGPPNDKFLWPMELALDPNVNGFGYIMPLRENRYRSIIDMMKRQVEPNFRTLATAGLELSHCFLQLHSKGLCYRDISFGNVFLDADKGEVLICDNDNVTVNGTGTINVLGTPRFMAPEVVRGEAVPSIQTDLFSLSVLLFYMFMLHHPLEGKKESSIKCFDLPAMTRIYGTEPLFIFDPSNDTNRPDPRYHETVMNFWSVYPSSFQGFFTRAFTEGVRDAQSGRIQESEWKAAMVRLRDSIMYCGHCMAENFYDAEALRASGQSGHPCWSCKQEMVLPPRIRVGREVIMLNHNTELFPHHLDVMRPYDFSTPLASVVRHPRDPDIWGLKNLSNEKWVATTTAGAVNDVELGRSVTLAGGTKIRFGKAEGEIRT